MQTLIGFLLNGVPGVYMLINRENPGRYYIGSSVNLGRRLSEYFVLTTGARTPKSNAEREIAQTPADGWNVVILDIGIPQVVLILEQLALFTWQPTINRVHTIVPVALPAWGNLQPVISLIEDLLKQYALGSVQHQVFSSLHQAYVNINAAIVAGVTQLPNSMVGRPVFVYDREDLDSSTIYGSINYALQALSLSHGRLLSLIANQYLFGSLVLSFTPLSRPEIEAYTEDTSPQDNQLRVVIRLYDDQGYEVSFTGTDGNNFTTFDSLRAFSKYFDMDPKKGRTIVSSGKFQDYTIVSARSTNRTSVYQFDATTAQLVNTFSSLTEAQKSAKVRFGTMKSLMQSQKAHKGFIYSSNSFLRK